MMSPSISARSIARSGRLGAPTRRMLAFAANSQKAFEGRARSDELHVALCDDVPRRMSHGLLAFWAMATANETTRHAFVHQPCLQNKPCRVRRKKNRVKSGVNHAAVMTRTEQRRHMGAHDVSPFSAIVLKSRIASVISAPQLLIRLPWL